MYVKGIRSGTLCRVYMRGPDGDDVSAGTFRYRWGADDSAVLSAALDLSRAEALSCTPATAPSSPRSTGGDASDRNTTPRGGIHVTKTLPAIAAAGTDRAARDRRLRQQQQQQLELGRRWRLRIRRRIDDQAAASSESSANGTAAVITVGTVPKLGKVLVDSKGLTLYDFHKDKGGKSACYGACEQVWPPLTTEGEPQAGEGAMASKLGTTKRKDGTMQVTYAGWPLYTYVADKKPGEANGNDIDSFGAEWYALQPSGEEAEGLGRACGRRSTGGTSSRISASSRTASSPGSSPGFAWPSRGSKKRIRSRGRRGKPVRSDVPSIATQTIFASGTSSARRPTPLRARSTLPRERVPSGKTPMQEPRRSSSIARARAPASPASRSIGIWPMPLRTGARPRTFQRSDLARALIWRRRIAEIPTMIGSQWLSWLPTTSTGPLSGSSLHALDPQPPPERHRPADRHRRPVHRARLSLRPGGCGRTPLRGSWPPLRAAPYSIGLKPPRLRQGNHQSDQSHVFTGPAVEGTRLASAVPIRTLNPGCVNPNYLKCHL